MSEPRPPAVRPWLLVALGLAALLAAFVAVNALVASLRRLRANTQAHLAEERTARRERQNARIHVTLAPVPAGLPLLGTPGIDADGYPLQYVDSPGLRALLAARRFQELSTYFERLQLAFEVDPRKEYWPSDAGEAFETAEPEILPALNDWVAATPGSFAPYLARGNHYAALMWAQRGYAYRDRTPEENIRAMREAAALAIADLDRAIELRPKLVSAMTGEMHVALPISDGERETRMRALAFGTCPACFAVRSVFMNSLTPRWGGSYTAMAAFVATLSPRYTPRFRALGGYADFDRANSVDSTDRSKSIQISLGFIDKALSYGEYWRYLLRRGEALRALERFDESMTALNRADTLRPLNADILAERAALHCNRKEYVAAGHDLLTALRVDPTHDDAKRYATDVINGLLEVANASESAGKHDEAREAVGLVLSLCPEDERGRAFAAKIGGS
jgi:hypothetical protein